MPPEKNGFIKCAWGRNNWTSREWGFRSCHSLRSFSSVRRVWWCQIVAQNQRHIHIHRHSRFPVCYPRKGLLYFVIADSLGFKWSVSPAFFFSRVCNEHLGPFLFAQTLDLQRCSLNTVFFQVTIEARYKPSEAWRFIIAPIFSLTVTINSLRKLLSSCGCICSIFLFSCLDFRNSESKPTSRLVFDTFVCFSVPR